MSKKTLNLTKYSGAGESGKSTIAKQMRIIYLEGFGDEERLHFKDIIYSNLMTCMRSLIQGAIRIGVTLQNPDLAKEIEEAGSFASAKYEPERI